MRGERGRGQNNGPRDLQGPIQGFRFQALSTSGSFVLRIRAEPRTNFVKTSRTPIQFALRFFYFRCADTRVQSAQSGGFFLFELPAIPASARALVQGFDSLFLKPQRIFWHGQDSLATGAVRVRCLGHRNSDDSRESSGFILQCARSDHRVAPGRDALARLRTAGGQVAALGRKLASLPASIFLATVHIQRQLTL